MVPRQFQIGMFINNILATSASLFMSEFLKTILECQFLIGFSNFDLTLPAQSVTMPLAVVLLGDLNALTQSTYNQDLSLFNSTTCLESIQNGSGKQNRYI